VVLCPYCLAEAAPSGNSPSAANRSRTWTVVRSTTARPVTHLRFIGRMDPIGLCRNAPCFAINRRSSPSTREISAPATSNNRAALSAIAPSADWRSVDELEIIRSTSEVAVSRSSASSRSRRRRASSLSRPRAGDLRRRNVGATRRFTVSAPRRRRDLARLLLFLERRAIACPRLRTTRQSFTQRNYSRELRLAK
jgi:hypothetical protein